MLMKRFIPLLALLALPLGFVACDEEENLGHHQVALLPLSPQGRVLFADQITDTLYVYSTESWKLEAKSHEGAPWFTPDRSSLTVPPQQVITQAVALNTTPNTTGKVRRGYVQLYPSHPKLQGLQMPVQQFPWLNIERPLPRWVSPTEPPRFVQMAKAKDSESTIGFRLYTTELNTVSLTSQADWCTVPTTQWQRGLNLVKLSLNPNLSKQPRTTQLTLTAAGVSTTILLTQKGDT